MEIAPAASGPCGQTTLNWKAAPTIDAMMTPISGHLRATRRWPATKQQAPVRSTGSPNE